MKMTDRRQKNFETNERRQVYNRINELKTNCERLRNLRENLRSRLSELNEAADNLIDDKKNARSDSCSKSDLFGAKTTSQQTFRHQNRGQTFTSVLTTNDLNDNDEISSHFNEREPVNLTLRVPPSDTFKMKLSQCLAEIAEKADEIADLSERLTTGSDNFYEQIL